MTPFNWLVASLASHINERRASSRNVHRRRVGIPTDAPLHSVFTKPTGRKPNERVIQLIREGLNNKQICHALNYTITEPGVNFYRTRKGIKPL